MPLVSVGGGATLQNCITACLLPASWSGISHWELESDCGEGIYTMEIVECLPESWSLNMLPDTITTGHRTYNQLLH